MSVTTGVGRSFRSPFHPIPIKRDAISFALFPKFYFFPLMPNIISTPILHLALKCKTFSSPLWMDLHFTPYGKNQIFSHLYLGFPSKLSYHTFHLYLQYHLHAMDPLPVFSTTSLPFLQSLSISFFSFPVEIVNSVVPRLMK
jgi:hypothetical protein